MKRAPSLLLLNRNNREDAGAGFTLVEILVAVAVLAIIVVLVGQVMQGTMSAISETSRPMQTSAACVATLDRLGNDISNMISTGPATMVVIKNSSATAINDEIGFIVNSRVRSRTLSTDYASVSNYSYIRMAAKGYCVAPTAASFLNGSPSVPMLNWGNGTLLWNGLTPGGASLTQNYVQAVPLTALAGVVSDLKNVVSTGSTTGSSITTLQFLPMSSGIFRFEVSFLLSNGTLLNGATVATAPAPTVPINKTAALAALYSSTAPVIYPLAFNSADAGFDSSGNQLPYVRAIVVGIAGIDSVTQATMSPAQLASLPAALPKPADSATPANNLTPLQTWDISNSGTTCYGNLKSPNYPAQVLQNICFSQRFYYVN